MGELTLRFVLNGVDHLVSIPPRTRLADLLRDEFGLTSVHVGCEQGTCGSCTVLVDGEPTRSCNVLAAQVGECSLTTLEGLRATELMRRLHAAFAGGRALQCGFCTPGLLVAAYAMFSSANAVSSDDVTRLVEGHLCRCTGYAPIASALQNALSGGTASPDNACPAPRHAPPARPETDALLDGAVRFVSETRVSGMAHGTFLRSPHSAATIRAIDARAARSMPGVLAVFTSDDLDEVSPLPQVMPHPSLSSRTPTALARGRVRYAGEPVCLVVATTQEAADDAAECIAVDWLEEPAALDVERACCAEAVRVHDDLDGNVAATFHQAVGVVEQAFAEAACVVQERFRVARLAAQALEPRAITARYVDDRLTLWLSSQSPHSARKIFAQQTGLPIDSIRVIATRAGGGFGFKNRYYPEYSAIAIAAIRLRRAVRWVETRAESFAASYHAGEQVHDAALAVFADGRIAGVRDEFLYDQGAYTPLGIVVPWITSVSIPGPYRVPAYEVRASVVLTNKTPASFYRGAGKPQATFVMERLLDIAADRLNMDRAEIRRRNLLAPGAFPYPTRLADIDGREIVYDSGNLPRCLDEVTRRLHHAAFADEQARALDCGRHIGCGIACYVEKSGIGPFEGARVDIDEDGAVTACSGISTQGQGHEEMIAQLCAERLCVPAHRVRVVLGDTDAITASIGTYCARGAVMAGNAVAQAAERVRDRLFAAAAELMAVDTKSLRLEPRGIVDLGGRTVASLAEVARYVAAHPRQVEADGETGPGLQATVFFNSDRPAFASGAYGVVVEVDLELWHVRILRHCIVHDCGVALNAAAVEQQLAGGLLFGVGRALTERFQYDVTGRPLTDNYATYALPRASDIPAPIIARVETPSPFNPLGVKGVGEAGVIPVGAAIAAAVEHALDRTVRIRSLPVDALTLIETRTADHVSAAVLQRAGAGGRP